jgi:hypothetical protein
LVTAACGCGLVSLFAGAEPVPGTCPSERRAPDVPVECLPTAARAVLENPTLVAAGPGEAFRGSPALYFWLLDHPDQAMRAWRRFGARCSEINDLGDGRFTWTDGQGSTVRWETVYRDRHRRVWYAEGSSRPAWVLPSVPLRAVVILNYAITRDDADCPLVQHQADLFFQTDSRTARLITHLVGSAAPRLAEQGMGQLEIFFSALVGYLERHPDQAAVLRRS